MTSPTRSPAPRRHAPQHAALDLPRLLGDDWRQLPPAVQRRFAPSHATAVYAGSVDLHCSLIGRLFAIIARPFGAPLCSARGARLPAVVRVAPDGRGGVVWERHLRDGDGRDHLVRSTKTLDPAGCLWEETAGGLRMQLAVSVQEQRLVFTSLGYALRLLGRQVRVPALLGPGRCTVTHEDLGPGRFRFTLDMRHPLWGRTFFQRGEFFDPPSATPAP